MRSRHDLRWVIASLVLAMILSLLPMPRMLYDFKPYWLGMVLVFWLLHDPGRIGIGAAFIIGLLGDVLQGDLLGSQALRCVIIAFIILRFRTQLNLFAPMQQAMYLLPLFINDRVVQWLILRTGGYEPSGYLFWIGALVATMLWPVLDVVLMRVSLRQRGRRSE